MIYVYHLTSLPFSILIGHHTGSKNRFQNHCGFVHQSSNTCYERFSLPPNPTTCLASLTFFRLLPVGSPFIVLLKPVFSTCCLRLPASAGWCVMIGLDYVCSSSRMLMFVQVGGLCLFKH